MTAPGNYEKADEFRQTEPPRTLSNRDRDIFLALLDADPEPTEAAKKAAARFNEGHFVGEVYHFSSPHPEAGDTPR